MVVPRPAPVVKAVDVAVRESSNVHCDMHDGHQ